MVIEVERINLPNGWHRVPGDGKTEQDKATIDYDLVSRMFAWAFLEDGLVIGLTGWIYYPLSRSGSVIPSGVPNGDLLYTFEHRKGKNYIANRFLSEQLSEWDGLFEIK